jgi:hypothetical protein
VEQLQPYMELTLAFCSSQSLLHASSTLQAAALLALCKLMCVSDALCKRSLQLIFTILAKRCVPARCLFSLSPDLTSHGLSGFVAAARPEYCHLRSQMIEYVAPALCRSRYTALSSSSPFPSPPETSTEKQ